MKTENEFEVFEDIDTSKLAEKPVKKSGAIILINVSPNGPNPKNIRIRFNDEELLAIRTVLSNTTPEDFERMCAVKRIVPLFKAKKLYASTLEKLDKKLN